MTSDAILILQTLFGPIWSLFTSWSIPGTRVSPAEWAFFVLGTILCIKILKRLLFDHYNDDFNDKGGGSGLIPRH